jgi:hypothetical protein
MKTAKEIRENGLQKKKTVQVRGTGFVRKCGTGLKKAGKKKGKNLPAIRIRGEGLLSAQSLRPARE